MIGVGGGVALSCARHGPDVGLSLVLVPGPTDSWRSYEPVLELLPPTVPAVAVSPRGHGDSDAPDSGYRVEDLAADVLVLLDRLGLERAVLAGHSGSCLAVRRVAIDRPDRVAGLVLEASPVTLRGNAGLEALVASVIAQLTDPVDEDFVRSFVVDTSSPAVHPSLLDTLVAEAQKVPARVWRAVLTALLAYDDVEELDRIAAPVLLVWGDADPLVDRAAQEDLLARLSTVELAAWPGVVHTPRWEDPARFAAEVAAFVQRLSA